MIVLEDFVVLPHDIESEKTVTKPIFEYHCDTAKF